MPRTGMCIKVEKNEKILGRTVASESVARLFTDGVHNIRSL
jgi:hypothetical protein